MGDDQQRQALFLQCQQSEVDGAALYSSLARTVKDKNNRAILTRIAEDETRHARIFQAYTKTQLKPGRLKLALYRLAGWIFGFTFSLKIFERDEEATNANYAAFPWKIPELTKIMADEERHEDQLISMLDEERIRYTGSIVLGMNDALVELTGSLAGYTLAMRDSRLIAMVGLITGLSATLSMAASGYLSARADGRQDALKSSIYTGFAYLLTVLLLSLPFLVSGRDGYMGALVATLCTAVGIIAVFNAYSSVVLDRPFKKGFLEMAGLSLGVAAISFVVGILVKQFLGVDL